MIEVIVDDLALAQADAVLRPTDQTLSALTETISRLDQQAGPRFAEQRRLSSPLKAGSAVVTGSGALSAPFVLHAVIRDDESGVGREVVRRALVSAWQRANDWELKIIASPLVGAGAGQLSPEEAAALLVQTFPSNDSDGFPAVLRIVLEADADRQVVESILRRTV